MSQSKVFPVCIIARDQYKPIPTMHFVRTTLASVLGGDHKVPHCPALQPCNELGRSLWEVGVLQRR